MRATQAVDGLALHSLVVAHLRQSCGPSLVGSGPVPNRTRRPSTAKPSRAIRPTASTSIARSATLIRSCSDSTLSSSSTGTALCATIGPVSTPASTTKSVQPVTLTPYASASAGPCMPGNDGESAGWVLTVRPP